MFICTLFARYLHVICSLFDNSYIPYYSDCMRKGYDYKALVETLCRYEREEEWFEFKTDNSNPERIGMYISALSNSAALCEHSFGYLIWGIDDLTHNIVGTSFIPQKEKKGNMDLESWLAVNLFPRVSFSFINLEWEDGKRIVILEISAADSQPVSFQNEEYIRIASTLQPLKKYPEKERELWRSFERENIEYRIVEEDLTAIEVASVLALDDYFVMQNLPMPSNEENKIKTFIKEGFVNVEDNGRYGITTAGALLFARNILTFPAIASKALRLVIYSDESKLNARNDITFTEGYAISFNNICSRIEDELKKIETIGAVYREENNLLPLSAVREVVANLLIHQDLTIRGSGPCVDVFSTRLEATNPGRLLVAKDRIIDAPPKVRNEVIAAFLRRMHFCEERGSGFDRIDEGFGAMHLPSVLVETDADFTRVILSWLSSFKDWSIKDKVRTIYYSSCLDYLRGRNTNNMSVRSRLGLQEKDIAIVSRLVQSTVNEGLIKLEDPSAGPRARKYIPYWA